MKKMKFLIPAFALVALTFAGCSDDGDDQPVVTKLALADPAQAALTFVATSPEAQVIALDTDASTVTVEQVLAEGEEKAEWCVVTVQSATQIKVAPASNLTTEERTAKYRISAGTVTPVEFTVTQPGIPNDELSIPAEYESGSMHRMKSRLPRLPIRGRRRSNPMKIIPMLSCWVMERNRYRVRTEKRWILPLIRT